MNILYITGKIVRRLLVEMIELLVAAHGACLVLVVWPVIGLAFILTRAFIAGTHLESINQVLIMSDVFSLFIRCTAVLYFAGLVWRMVRPKQWWWSVRRKISLVLTGITMLYMVVSIELYIHRIPVEPAPWIFRLGVVVGVALYAYLIRYGANKIIHRVRLTDLLAVTSTTVKKQL